MKDLHAYHFYFLTGSQDLYGEETLLEVAKHSKTMVNSLNEAGTLPCKLVWQETLIDSPSIVKAIQKANSDPLCAGIVCWMHTFSPAKMWINGLRILNKPLLQVNTQFNEAIPYQTMDMDFMNLNQSAHGDREFGHITSRLDLPRKVIVGHWKNGKFQQRLAKWMGAAAAAVFGRELIILRFGDNMREVAVTDGDKVEAMVKLGWSVPYYGIGDLVEEMDKVSELQVDELMATYRRLYEFQDEKPETIASVREQAKMETAIKKFLDDRQAEAFCTNFQDLHGLKQLPGLAAQHLMQLGYGFGAEGDWKTAGMVRTMKFMGGIENSCSFMEDYTYNLVEGNQMNLAAHMLEVCPTIAKDKPTVEVHPLGIGGKEDPARLVFTGKPGKAMTVSIVDLGNRFRIICDQVQAVDPPEQFTSLPVARCLWKPIPDFTTATEAWILAGAGHHCTLTYAVDLEMLRDLAEILRIELLEVTENTTIRQIRNEAHWNRAYYDRT
ncbi:MAG: L-arabinose isomerase [Spirochaetia bacterium]|jgi:L-arabinose isomerase|nr:L-arabinose isomerase [Spirochaetia bacterium]